MDDSFKLVEEKIRLAADRLKELRSENESLRGDLEAAATRADQAERKLASVAEHGSARDDAVKKAESLGREVKSLRKEREEIRARLGRLLTLLEELEESPGDERL